MTNNNNTNKDGIKNTKLFGTTGRGAGEPTSATGMILGLWHCGQRYCIATP
jgi:predicted nucleotidyltransferase